MLLPLPDAEILDPGGGVNENETVHLALGRYPCMIADRFRAGNLELSPSPSDTEIADPSGGVIDRKSSCNFLLPCCCV